jgi:transcriptional regulator with XRE-family HTH domain
MGELGSTLRRAREARGLTLEDAERDTRISRRYLQALENEEFDIIPAPVYARGFLRSYSQYLGLDPQRMLALFPIENGPASRYAPPRAAAREAESPPPGRPQWRRPTPEPFTPPSRGVRPLRQGERPGSSQGSGKYEPMIGVDIGVPRRPIEVGSAAPARTAIAAAAAIAITLFVLGLAFIIAQVGGGDSAAPPPTATATATSDSSSRNDTPSATSGLEVTPGVVPNVIGQPVEVARLAIAEAGFVPSERVEPSDRPAGIVIDQGPAPGVRGEPGDTVFIVVSGGR